MTNSKPASITNIRRRTALVLAGTELPACFAESTLSALCNALDRGSDKRAVRRLSGKVVRLGMVQA